MSISVITMRVQKGLSINYCYLIFHRKTKFGILLDPAWEPDKINAMISKHQIILKAILLTHHHPDHIDLADFFSSSKQIPVYMSSEEIMHYGFACTYLSPLLSEEPLYISNIRVKPIFTPGHTSGCTCYLIGKNIFTGDVLFNEGCGLCLGKGSDPIAMFYSLQKLKKEIAKTDYVYPGHCYGLPVGQSFEVVLKNNIYLDINDVDSFVKFRMRPRQRGLFDFR